MPIPGVDKRSPGCRVRDEQIAAEAPPAPLELPGDTPAAPVEAHPYRQRRRPVAVAGVVENGLVRPLDPAVKLAEHARVSIVASERV